jgi:small subunit ribosomal protein S1
VLHLGQLVKAQVLEVDKAKRQVRLSMKQRTSVTVDEYLAEHAMGSVVTGRIVEVTDGVARVELGEGVAGLCRAGKASAPQEASQSQGKVDISSLTSMLQARWKGGPRVAAQPEALTAGQIRSFRIAPMEPDAKTIELELA